MRNVSRPELHELVFHAIANSMLFISVSDNDRPFERVADVRDETSRKSVLLRKSVVLLFYLPAVAVVLLFIVDVLSLTTIPAVFRPGHKPLLIRVIEGSADLGFDDILQLIAMSLFELVLAIFTIVATRRVVHFENATTSVIKDYASLNLKSRAGTE
jgi:hypothetical protein